MLLGGVVRKEPKISYQGDLDIFIKTDTTILDKTSGEHVITPVRGEDNLARRISLEASSGRLPEHHDDHLYSKYVNVMLSEYLPHQYSVMEPGEEEIFYDFETSSWYLAAPDV